MKIRKFLAVLLVYLVWTVVLARSEEKNEEENAVFFVRIVADQYYREYRSVGGNWRADLNTLIDRVNRKFQEEGIKASFEVIEISEWEISESEILEEALKELKKDVPRGGYDLVIGVTRKEFLLEHSEAGFCGEDGYIVARDYDRMENPAENIEGFFKLTLSIVTHEIGHFFGLDHTDDSASIMHFRCLGESFLKEEIDAINKKAKEMKNKK